MVWFDGDVWLLKMKMGEGFATGESIELVCSVG